MNKREPRLSQTDYVNREGRECPWCESTHIYRGDPLFGGKTMTMDAECALCDSTWEEEYKLTGYQEVK